MKIAGEQDFSGQKQQNAGEGTGNPEQAPTSTSQPVDRPRGTRIFRTRDPRLHTDASYRPGDGREDGTP